MNLILLTWLSFICSSLIWFHLICREKRREDGCEASVTSPFQLEWISTVFLQFISRGCFNWHMLDWKSASTMFGVKLRTWMESHIVRPRKKQGLGGKIASGKGGKVAPERSLLDSAGNSPTSPVTDAKHHRLHHTHQGVSKQQRWGELFANVRRKVKKKTQQSNQRKSLRKETIAGRILEMF